MKLILAVILTITLSACSIEIKKEVNLGFTQEELNQAACLGSYKTVNGVYVSPKIDTLSPKVKQAYQECMNAKTNKGKEYD